MKSLSAKRFIVMRTSTAPGPNTSRAGLAAVAALLVVFFSLRHGTFFTTGNAVAIGIDMSSIAIAGAGTMVLIIAGYVDLSIGSMYALLGMIVAEIAVHVSSPVVVVAAGLFAGLVLGFINGLLVRLLKISPLIVTIGLLATYGGLAYVVSENDVFGFSSSFVNLGQGRLAGVPYPVIVAAVVLLLVGFVLTRTVTGLRLYAAGGDRRAAERAGIRVDRMVVAAYAFNGMMIGLAATLTTAQLSSGSPALGTTFVFDVITAVILGGVAFAGGAGRPFGLVIGVLTIGILNSGLIFEGLQAWWQQVAKGGILLVALGADQLGVARRARNASRVEIAPDTEADASSATGEGPASVDGRAASNGRPVRPLSAEPTAVLELRGVSKRFGAVVALHETSLTLNQGEVVALLGDNGAGKSTLVKIISGALHPDQGELLVDGKHVAFRSPADARTAGVETVYQDLALCPNLSVVHNLELGNESKSRLLGVLPVRDDRNAAANAERRLAALGIHLQDPSALVDSLSGGQRQAIAIARALDDHVRVVCLDEPTAALGVTQTEQVLRLVRSVASHGTSVVLITHDVASVTKVADRVVVLRRGRLVHEGPTADLTELDLLQLMAGLDPSVAASPRGQLVS